MWLHLIRAWSKSNTILCFSRDYKYWIYLSVIFKWFECLFTFILFTLVYFSLYLWLTMKLIVLIESTNLLHRINNETFKTHNLLNGRYIFLIYDITFSHWRTFHKHVCLFNANSNCLSFILAYYLCFETSYTELKKLYLKSMKILLNELEKSVLYLIYIWLKFYMNASIFLYFSGIYIVSCKLKQLLCYCQILLLS